jgi:hypothetical protein
MNFEFLYDDSVLRTTAWIGLILAVAGVLTNAPVTAASGAIGFALSVRSRRV